MILGVVHLFIHWIIGSLDLHLCRVSAARIPRTPKILRPSSLEPLRWDRKEKKTHSNPNNAWEGWRWESYIFWGKGIKELKFISRNIWHIYICICIYITLYYDNYESKNLYLVEVVGDTYVFFLLAHHYSNKMSLQNCRLQFLCEIGGRQPTGKGGGVQLRRWMLEKVSAKTCKNYRERWYGRFFPSMLRKNQTTKMSKAQ